MVKYFKTVSIISGLIIICTAHRTKSLIYLFSPGQTCDDSPLRAPGLVGVSLQSRARGRSRSQEEHLGGIPARSNRPVEEVEEVQQKPNAFKSSKFWLIFSVCLEYFQNTQCKYYNIVTLVKALYSYHEPRVILLYLNIYFLSF